MRMSSLRSLHPRERLMALSDGVFAVAITFIGFDLLAAATHTPEGEPLGHALAEQWPTYLAYIVGFLTILVCWINHQVVYENVPRMNAGLVWLNGAQIALVAAVPMPTALLAEHLEDEGQRLAFTVYGVAFLLMALSFWATGTFITRRSLLAQHADTGLHAGLTRCYAYSVTWTAAAILVCQVNVILAVAMWSLMFALFAFPLQFGDWARREVPAD